MQVYTYQQVVSFGATPNSGFSVVVGKLPTAGFQKLLFKMSHVSTFHFFLSFFLSFFLCLLAFGVAGLPLFIFLLRSDILFLFLFLFLFCFEFAVNGACRVGARLYQCPDSKRRQRLRPQQGGAHGRGDQG